MKVSKKWLEKYFDAPLPDTKELADLFTFHAFEIEEAEGDLLDVKVLPDRAAYALSHRGIASEAAAILNRPLKVDPLKQPAPAFAPTDALTVTIEDEKKCFRYMGAVITGVKVGPSPAWLTEALESVGQRSINNVVDATNYVMLDIGQPLHAFDAHKLTAREGKRMISVRGAAAGEKITTLTGDEYTLPEGTLLIVDAAANVPVGIAGVKGGKAAEIDASTTEIVIESANFDGSMVRKAAQSLKLFTDASTRYQNRISPELAGYGMDAVTKLILQIAGGELRGVVDVRAGLPQEHLAPIHISLEKINRMLGTELGAHDVAHALDRLGLSFVEESRAFSITPSFERRDIQIPEDVAEEVGRILGYDKVPSIMLPPLPVAPDQLKFRGIERVKDLLVERGFTEISTPAFAVSGEVELANPLQSDKPWLRATLQDNMEEALTRAVQVAPKVLGPDHSVRLFEVGNVFTASGERLMLSLGYKAVIGKPKPVMAEIADALSDLLSMSIAAAGDVIEVPLGETDLEKLGADYEPRKIVLQKFRPFSMYPFALRDIAVWSPAGTEESEVSNAILAEAGDLVSRMDLFDRFEKDGRVSHAFRLVFESSEKTLSDADLNPVMGRVTVALNAKEGWEVR